MEMNPDVKQKWVEALRSGDYGQTTSFLRTSEGFCCLGVLCDLYHNETGLGKWKLIDYTDGKDVEGFQGNDQDLPEEVRSWAGLKFHSPAFEFSKDGLYNAGVLSELNDSNFRFREIADIIEKGTEIR